MKKNLLATLVLLFTVMLSSPSSAFAAITFDNAAEADTTGSVNISVGSLTNGIAIGIALANSNCTSAATFGGSSMTVINTPGTRLTEFYLLNPPSGSQTFAASGCTYRDSYIATYGGASGVNASSSTAFTSGVSFTGTLTTTADNSWVVTSIGDFNGGTSVGSTNVTERAGLFSGKIGDSNSAVTPAGSFSQTWTGAVASAGNPVYVAQVAITPAATPAAIGGIPSGLVSSNWW